MKIKPFCFLLLIVFLTSLCNMVKGDVLVATIQELNQAIAAAKPGSMITMKDGIWHNVDINFTAKASKSAEITLRAQTPGKVILNGTSKLTFLAPYLIVDGLFFKEGALSESSNSVVTFASENCRLTNVAIVDYNPASFDTKYYWVYFQGSYNRMDHCIFKGKNNMQPVVQNDEENSLYNKVDSCYVKDIPFVAEANGREIFRIFGYGHADQTGDGGAYFTIEYNLFDHADGEGTEIVSLKSNHNLVQYNTVIASRGGLVGRRGKYNTFHGNFILGQNYAGSTGIRVAGSYHRVTNNYIADVAEDGLRLITGEYYEKSLTDKFAPKKKALPKYLQVKEGYFANNTIVNCGGYGVDIGFAYKNQWPSLQMVLFPEGNRFDNNIIYNTKSLVIHEAKIDKNSPLDGFSFKPNYFSKNIVFGNVSPAMNADGFNMLNPMLKLNKEGLYVMDIKSPAINFGYLAFQNDVVIPSNKNGVNKSNKSPLLPLSALQVGPKWWH